MSAENHDHESGDVGGRYVLIKALEDGVTIIGLTRGRDTRFSHTEKLDRGEVMVAQFTEVTAAIKIRGRAEVHTEVGTVTSGSPGEGAAGFTRPEKA